MNFPLFLARKWLRPRRDFASAIPVITVCGVMLGVAILMIVLAVMTGFGDTWREKILSYKPHVTVRSVFGDMRDEGAACAAVEAVPGVVSASPAILMPAMIRPDGAEGAIPVSVVGIDPDRPSVLAAAANSIVDGQFAPVDDGAVVGADLAARLRCRPGSRLLCYSPLNLRSADELHLPEEMTVAGVFDLGMRDVDDGVLVCSLGMARDLLGMDSGATLVQIQVEEPEKAAVAAELIADALGPSYRVSTWQDEDRVLFDALRTEKTMMFVLLAFIAVVAAFCVTNTLIVVVIQKTREIGLMKALGFSPGRIRSAFVLAGLLQCALGETLGLALGRLVLENLQNLVAALASCGLDVFPKAVYGLAEIPWRVVPGDVAAVVAVVTAFCFAASFLPAALAARLDPVKAMNQQ
ncbi:MAG: ABC transporter permease [Kiritimatiellae bacterium]|nr:ABC transporter permease [Kiritimatiellia bacterium]